MTEFERAVEMRAKELRAMRRLDVRFYAEKAAQFGMSSDCDPVKLAQQEIFKRTCEQISDLTEAWENTLIEMGIF